MVAFIVSFCRYALLKESDPKMRRTFYGTTKKVDGGQNELMHTSNANLRCTGVVNRSYPPGASGDC